MTLIEALLDPGGLPRTVGDLVSALGVTVDAAALEAGGRGTLTIAVATPGAGIRRLDVRYSWFFTESRPIGTFDELSQRTLVEWKVETTHGAEAIEGALRARHGAPREVGAHRVYGSCILSRGDAGSVELAVHTKLPDWAVPPADAELRARVLLELAAAVEAAEDSWATHAVARVLDGLPEQCGVRHDAADRKRGGFSIELVPAISSTELVRIFGWQNPVGQCRTMHMTDWTIWLAVGKNDFGATQTSRPTFGRWPVVASLDRRPTGGDLDAGAFGPPLGGTYALAPVDLVRKLSIGLGIAPGPPPQPAPRWQPHTCASCGQTNKLLETSPVKTPPDEEGTGLDGRPAYGGGLASDASVLARELALISCPSCGHVAPSIATPSRYMSEAREAREELFALTHHCEDARRYLYVAQLYREDDLREQGMWSLRAAWADEAAGLEAVARRVRRRAGVELEEAVRSGTGPSPLVLAEIFRTAGESDRAAEHCLRGLESTLDEGERALLLAEASLIVERSLEPATRAGARERAQGMDEAQRVALIARLRR